MRHFAERRVRVAPEQAASRPVPIAHTLVSATTIGTAETIMTVRADAIADVQRFCVANTSGSAATLSLHSVPSGGSAAAGNTELPAVSIPANTAVDVTDVIGGVYEQGTTLQVFAGTTGVLVVHGWYRELF